MMGAKIEATIHLYDIAKIETEENHYITELKR